MTKLCGLNRGCLGADMTPWQGGGVHLSCRRTAHRSRHARAVAWGRECLCAPQPDGNCADWLLEDSYSWGRHVLNLATTHYRSPTRLRLLHKQNVPLKLESDRNPVLCAIQVLDGGTNFCDFSGSDILLVVCCSGRAGELQGFSRGPRFFPFIRSFGE